MMQMVRAVIDREVIGRVINSSKSLITKISQTLSLWTFYRHESLENKELGMDRIMSFISRVSNSGDCKFNFALSFPGSHQQHSCQDILQ